MAAATTSPGVVGVPNVPPKLRDRYKLTIQRGTSEKSKMSNLKQRTQLTGVRDPEISIRFIILFKLHFPSSFPRRFNEEHQTLGIVLGQVRNEDRAPQFQLLFQRQKEHLVLVDLQGLLLYKILSIWKKKNELSTTLSP